MNEDSNKNSQAIGVFDSGIGGLSVLKELMRAFPNEDFIYVGDTARLPYGSKSPETIRKYSLQIMNYLLTQKVKAIVIACNSASSQVHETEYKGIPVYNVITPGAKKALEISTTKSIGVLGTRATIQSEAYKKQLLKLDPSCKVHSIACPLFVPLAEEGMDQHPITNQVVAMYLQPLLTANKVDALILGCTHYPLLIESIRSFTKTIELIDSGTAVAETIMKDFKNKKISLRENPHQQQMILQTTDRSDHYKELARNILGLEKSQEFQIISL